MVSVHTRAYYHGGVWYISEKSETFVAIAAAPYTGRFYVYVLFGVYVLSACVCVRVCIWTSGGALVRARQLRRLYTIYKSNRYLHILGHMTSDSPSHRIGPRSPCWPAVWQPPAVQSPTTKIVSAKFRVETYTHIIVHTCTYAQAIRFRCVSSHTVETAHLCVQYILNNLLYTINYA